MDLLYWIVFGLIAGAIANMIDSSPAQGGILGSIVLGIVGAVVGGWLGSTFFGVGVTGFNISSFAVAVGGALILLYGARAFRRRTV